MISRFASTLLKRPVRWRSASVTPRSESELVVPGVQRVRRISPGWKSKPFLASHRIPLLSFGMGRGPVDRRLYRAGSAANAPSSRLWPTTKPLYSA